VTGSTVIRIASNERESPGRRVPGRRVHRPQSSPTQTSPTPSQKQAGLRIESEEEPHLSSGSDAFRSPTVAGLFSVLSLQAGMPWLRAGLDQFMPRRASNHRRQWAPASRPLECLADGYVLLGGANLVDLEKRIVLWQYQHANASYPSVDKTSGELGGVFWYGLTSGDRTAMGLFQASLPQPEVLTAAAQVTAAELIAVPPGGRVSLQVNVPGSAAEQESIRKALTENLTKSGFVVAVGSPAVLTASKEVGKSYQMSYQNFGGGQTQTISVTPQISRLKLILNGKSCWETYTVNSPPPFLSQEPDQSIEQPWRRTENRTLSTSVERPFRRRFRKHRKSPLYGASLLTHEGVSSATVQGRQ